MFIDNPHPSSLTSAALCVSYHSINMHIAAFPKSENSRSACYLRGTIIWGTML